MSIENVLFLDLETTGLDPKVDRILEVAAEVVAPDWSVVSEYSMVVHWDKEDTVHLMSASVHGQHFRSGLIQEVFKSELPWEDIEPLLYTWIKQYFPNGRAILAGNSIHFDRSFIKAQMPEVEKLLHFRMIDVTSIMEARRIFKAPHRALADIQASKNRLRNAL